MDTYSVTISQRPLGVRFGHISDAQDSNLTSICIHEVTANSHGAKLGLAVGDTLVAVNKENVSRLSSCEVLQLFRKQTLPFDVTFKLCFDTQPIAEEDQSDEFDEEDMIYPYINSTTTRTSATNSKWKDFATYESDEDSMSHSFTDDGTISEYSFSRENEDSFCFKPFHQISQHLLAPKTRNSGSIKLFSPFRSSELGKLTKSQSSNMCKLDPKAKPTQSTLDLVHGFIRSLAPNYNHEKDVVHSLIAHYLFNDTVAFDLRFGNICNESVNSTVIMLSSNGLQYGIFEWNIKV